MSQKRKSRKSICKVKQLKIDTDDYKIIDISEESMFPEFGNDIENVTVEPTGFNNFDVTLAQWLKLKLEQVNAKLDQQTAEIISLRSELVTIKAKVCGEVYKPKEVLPMEPCDTMKKLMEFEKKLQDSKLLKIFVAELLASGEKTFDKFIRRSWRLIVTDEVARQCSWRGTDAKKSVRELHTTLAIRLAFKQKFALDDADFDRTTQKFFQYAQDRLSKSSKKTKT